VDVLPPDFTGVSEIVGGVAEEIFPSRRIMDTIRFKMQVEETDDSVRGEQVERVLRRADR
jgi:hypothetical protein